MSFDALAWAAKAKGIRPAEKLVLLGLAECASREGAEAFPSIAALVEFGGLNRKTVIAALDSLIAYGLIAETGKFTGRTKQIKVYRLALETVPKVERFQKRNSSVFSGKESQKRDTDTVKEPVNPIKTHAHEIPVDWEPMPFGEDTQSRKIVDGWPLGEMECQTEQFRSSHGSKRNKFQDWQKAWATWVLNTRKFGIGKQDNGRTNTMAGAGSDAPGIGRTGRAALAAARMLHAAGHG